jgi:hypothetical protein
MPSEFPVELLVFTCGVIVFAALSAVLSNTSILHCVCFALSAFVLLFGYGLYNGISVVDEIVGTFGTYSIYAGVFSALGAFSCFCGYAFLAPDPGVRTLKQKREDRVIGIWFVVVGFVIWVVSYYNYCLRPSCELSEWTRWSPCSKNEVMRRTRSVIQTAGLLGKQCDALAESSWCSMDFDV